MKTILKRAVLIIFILLLWSIFAENANPLFVPKPTTVFAALIQTCQNGMLFHAIKYSFARITIATLISGVIAFPVAIMVYSSKNARNTDPNPTTDPDDVANKMLSEQRAETVKQYFVMNGISPNRIITVGNGSSNPVVDNDTDEHRAMNRRTDVSFKCVE